MIEVENQYVLMFSVDGYEDFLDEPQLEKLLIIEEVGNVLPQFECIFQLLDEDLIPYLREGKVIDIAMGQTDESMTNMRFKILKSIADRAAVDGYQVTIRGLLNTTLYNTDMKTKLYKKQPAISCMKEIVSQYFKWETNIDLSKDEQLWIQSNMPDKAIVNELWMHMNLTDSFPLVAITADGKFLCKDIKKAIKQANSDLPVNKIWEFISGDPEEENEINYGAKVTFQTEAGFINQWVGHPAESPSWDLIEGKRSTTKPDAKPLLANGSSDFKAGNSGKRMSEFICTNDNMNPMYWEAYDKNIQSLALFSATSGILTFSERLENMRPSDIVYFMDTDIEETDSASERYTGLYIIEKVVRQISDKQLKCAVKLCRELINMIDPTNNNPPKRTA